MGDVGELRAAARLGVVAEQVVCAADGDGSVHAVDLRDAVVAIQPGFDLEFTIDHFACAVLGKPAVPVEAIRQNKEVEVAVAIKIAEAGRQRGVADVQASWPGSFLEDGDTSVAVTSVDEELVRSGVIADMQVEVAITIQIGDAGSGRKALSTSDASDCPDLLKLPATSVQVEEVVTVSRSEK